MTARLVMLSGLPGAGKSTLAGQLRRALPAFVLSVDPVEDGLYRAGIARSEPAGLAAYVAVEVMAEPALAAGQHVVIDAVNDDPRARQQWHDLADRTQSLWRPLEVVCSDPDRHRRQLERRRRGLRTIVEPRWEELQPRRAALAGWDGVRLVVDSVGDVALNLTRVLEYVRSDGVDGTEPATR